MAFFKKRKMKMKEADLKKKRKKKKENQKRESPISPLKKERKEIGEMPKETAFPERGKCC